MTDETTKTQLPLTLELAEPKLIAGEVDIQLSSATSTRQQSATFSPFGVLSDLVADVAVDDDSSVYIATRDEGQGLLNNTNLFVPFFTTKAGGSGVGLVLSRQIAEAHGGTVSLRNRSDRRGAEAVVTLPIQNRH